MPTDRTYFFGDVSGNKEHFYASYKCTYYKDITSGMRYGFYKTKVQR